MHKQKLTLTSLAQHLNSEEGYPTASRSSFRSNTSALLNTPCISTPGALTRATSQSLTPEPYANLKGTQSNKTNNWNFEFNTIAEKNTLTPPPPTPFPLQSTTSDCTALSDTEAQEILTPDVVTEAKSAELPSLKRDDSDHSEKSRWQLQCGNEACCSKKPVYRCSFSNGIYGAYTVGYAKGKAINRKSCEECCTDRLSQLLAFCEPLKRTLNILKQCTSNNHRCDEDEHLFDAFCHVHMMHENVMTYCRDISDYFQREIRIPESGNEEKTMSHETDEFKDECYRIRWYLLQLNHNDKIRERRARVHPLSYTPPLNPHYKPKLPDLIHISKTISISHEDSKSSSPPLGPQATTQTSHLYIGGKEDNVWWTDVKPKDDALSDDDIHRILVKRMRVFRWQNAHGFMAGKESQEATHYQPKYANIKDEVLHNAFQQLPVDSWNQTLRKTDLFFKSFARKKIKTPQSGFYEDQICKQRKRWEAKEGISKKEIIILKLYTDFDKLQFALKKCFRFETYKDILRWSDTELYQQAKQDLKERLESFWHWRGALLVTLNKFGTKWSGKHNKTLYHGVNAKMIIKASHTFAFSGPLSTTSSFHVARTFATAKGMILTIGTQYPRLNYCNAFDVTLISEYPEEHEWLVGFMYVRLLKVSTRETALMNPNMSTLRTMRRKVPLSSWTRQMFFVIHLFDEQVFSMTEDLEMMLSIFLRVNRRECCQKPEIKKKNYLCSTLCALAHPEYAEEEKTEHADDNDEWRMKRIIAMLWRKFEEFCRKPTYKQHVRFDSISNGLKPFFMEETEEKSIETEEILWRISFKEITTVYPNIKEIYFMNEYKFDDEVLRKLMKQIKRKDNEIKNISFLYYNYEHERNEKPLNLRTFQDPDTLDKELVNQLNKMGWMIKPRKNGQTGYKIRIYNQTKK